METDVMIRALKYTANKHKNDRLVTFDTNITAMCNDVIPKLELLKAYEDIGPTPEQLLEIDKMYLEKCREVAELRAELKAYKDTGMTPEDTLDMIACMDKGDGYGPEEEIADLLELMRYRKAIGELEDKSERYHYLWHSLNDNSPYNAGRADAMRKAINILKGGGIDEKGVL